MDFGAKWQDSREMRKFRRTGKEKLKIDLPKERRTETALAPKGDQAGSQDVHLVAPDTLGRGE